MEGVNGGKTSIPGGRKDSCSRRKDLSSRVARERNETKEVPLRHEHCKGEKSRAGGGGDQVPVHSGGRTPEINGVEERGSWNLEREERGETNHLFNHRKI